MGSMSACPFPRDIIFHPWGCELVIRWSKIIQYKSRCLGIPLPRHKDSLLCLPREQRICKKCDLSEIGDEFHYLFRCNHFVKERMKYIKCKYYNFPSTLKFEELMCKQDMPSMLNLCRFIKFIMCV